ncbi:Flp family type IVb pilin [Jiella sonneratiae]|uniref:Flp family type IVb pilin n=1 Tax=Jiella sonneratiae TaxID=2816856 RepID=A0ABS3J5D3_9HYPH|nr:Flp family type IVb pilin [Jiella sonneratiae]MBO0904297.1 Flp family type IVb pilin [Jiella sonneratiae]
MGADVRPAGGAPALWLRRFGRCENGATAIEYALVGVVMAVGILAAYPLLKEPLTSLFSYIGDQMKVS